MVSMHIYTSWSNSVFYATKQVFFHSDLFWLICLLCFRSAARYNKGIEVLYTISMADHLLTAIRVTRKQGEQNMKQSRHLLHCRMCEERVVYPDTHTVLGNKLVYVHFFQLSETGPQIRVRNGYLFSYFSTKTYVVGTQKNRLNEAVLLSTQNTCLN